MIKDAPAMLQLLCTSCEKICNSIWFHQVINYNKKNDRLIVSCFTPFRQHLRHVTAANKIEKIDHLHGRLTMVAPKTKLLRVIWTIICISGSNISTYLYKIHSCFVNVTLYSELFIRNPYKNVNMIYCITWN